MDNQENFSPLKGADVFVAKSEPSRNQPMANPRIDQIAKLLTDPGKRIPEPTLGTDQKFMHTILDGHRFKIVPGTARGVGYPLWECECGIVTRSM